MCSNPLLIDKIIYYHITGFTSKVFQPHFNLEGTFQSKRGNAFFCFNLKSNNSCIFALHGTFIPEFVMHEQLEQVHDFCSTARKLDQSPCEDL